MRTKEKQFRHSTISVIDVKQTPVKVDTNSGVDFSTICKEFNNKDAQLILYLKKHNLEDNFNKLTNTLNKYDDYNVYIQLITEQEAPIEAIIANIDTLITGRNIDNLYNVELAEKYNKTIISGVDIPNF